MSNHPLRIFSGSAHPELAIEISKTLNAPLGKNTTRMMPDSETFVMIDEVVRDQDIFFIQPCFTPVNDRIMEILLYLDAFRRASTHSITLVIPYFPYARQDRMAHGRESISARVIANLLETMGTNRVVYVDIHNRAIQGFFNIPVDPLSALPLLADYFNKPEFDNSCIVSPDVGRGTMAGHYAERLNKPLVVMHKRRTPEDVETTHVVGDIKGRQPIVIDDVIASGSVLKQIDKLYEAGAEGKAYFAITHPVLLPKAIKILDEDDRIEKLIVTNTLPLTPAQRHPKIEVLSIAPMLAEIIYRIHEGVSISEKLVIS